MTDKHTPMPWKISEQSIAGYGKKEHARLYIEGKKGKYVCNIGNTDSLANAKLIVDSVNQVQQYREALEKVDKVLLDIINHQAHSEDVNAASWARKVIKVALKEES